MIMNSRFIFVIGFVFLGVFYNHLFPDNGNVSPTTQLTANEYSRDECAISFDEFAYQGPRERPEEKKLPLSPWEIEAIVPQALFEDHGLHQVSLIRSINGEQEIWITDYLNEQPLLAIYRSVEQDWEIISGVINNTGLFVTQLFVTTDGTVWGRIEWESIADVTIDNIPVLSKFNENSRRFEFADNVLEIPRFTNSRFFGSPKIVLDNQDNFWIFSENDGIYKYDPSNATYNKNSALAFNASQVTLAPDGSIFFRYLYYGQEDTLFRFIPESNELVIVEFPNNWPNFFGILVDSSNQLWLGATGYRTESNQWQLIHPNPDLYFEHQGDLSWAMPEIMLESSDGRLWYQRYLDSDYHNEGTAWYDPTTGEGCMFTNIPAVIVEDSNQNLWLIADGKLYRYQLNP